MKKAQGISINTIIIAAVALIVLVVLIAVFTGRMGIWGQQLDEAQADKLCKKGDGSAVGDMKMQQGNNCNDLDKGGQDWEQVYSNFKKCSSDETPSKDGCHETGYICCARKEEIK
ncbi:hypothetical protein GF323_01235 [Candidatus Woesearchaeota archaeon]|nr:hypothetical protein [Candidatus Woesearchaeota archaeon]